MAHQENDLANVISGVLLGVLVGGGLGLGACIFIFEDTLLFTGDTVLIGAVVCGTLGYFLGSGSSGDVIGLSGSFQVNFDSGVIDNGNLSLQTFGSENWSMTYGGTYQDSQAHMTIIDGDITGATNCTSCVTGHIDGIFVAPGDAFVGGFNLENVNDKNTHVEGVMLMEQ